MIEELRILSEETIFDTNAYYVIPRYQRAYAWEDREIVQLIDDINDIGSSENYYIGSLVVSKVEGNTNTYEVVDGQQRLTTLFLLFQYLIHIGILEGTLGQTLSFDCRSNSNYTLSNIQKILNKEIDDEERCEQNILNGLKAIEQKFKNYESNYDSFVSRLEHVILYRIEVPEHTDLNRYFEIMNTRGEQLEQHDILKAKLMGWIKNRNEQELFSKIWNACSDMTGYVQMHFSPSDRNNIFGNDWNDCLKNKNWKDCKKNCKIKNKKTVNSVTIKDIVANGFKINDVDGVLDVDTHIRFDSIIDFPYFLLHTLRVFVKLYEVQLEKPLGELLIDKKLISDFDYVLIYGKIKNKPLINNKESFSQMFIIHLLKTRYFFDKYIVKREYTGEDNEGEWSLKELLTSGQGSKKRAYYINTRLKNESEWEKTYAPRNKECLMIQSALRVSYTSPNVMHWITNLLLWISKDNDITQLTDEAEKNAAQATKKYFIDGKDYKLGVKTPHIVFNYLDYLLWKNNKKKYNDFEFEFRNSVEHWYPQNPSDGTFNSWDNKDTFGNLCIISRSVNSKFSNLSPESKMKSFEKMIKKGSLKLRIMGNITQEGSNKDWVNKLCQEHENEMIYILKEACEIFN